MITRVIAALFLPTLVMSIAPAFQGAQQQERPPATFRVEVNLVLLSVAVTDNKGNYVSGLKPWDFEIYEDDVKQYLSTFAEGYQIARRISEFTLAESTPQLIKPLSTNRRDRAPAATNHDQPGMRPTDSLSGLIAGANVFILFDTSNYMYRDFVNAQDAISDFVRFLDSPDRVALYSFSRDMKRVAPISQNRQQVLAAIRSTVVGDDSALYNALLLTVRDAAKLSGRKVVVVFSNGPDKTSVVAPESVRELAQAEGISIYMVSTREARQDPVSTTVFQRMSASTGGEAYFARSWQQQQKAFDLIREELAHLYLLSYYPQPNPNGGWRSITVKLVGDHLKKYQIRTRTGYRPGSSQVIGEPEDSRRQANRVP